MSSKRDLKRAVKSICAELFAECVAASLYSGENHEADFAPIYKAVLDLNAEYIRRISHPEPGMRARKYYDFLTGEFNKQVEEIVDQINSVQ